VNETSKSTEERFVLQWEIRPLPIPVIVRGYTGEVVVHARDLITAMEGAKRRVAEDYRVKPDRIEITRATSRARREETYGIY